MTNERTEHVLNLVAIVLEVRSRMASAGLNASTAELIELPARSGSPPYGIRNRRVLAGRETVN
jgi:hypothetical protein